MKPILVHVHIYYKDLWKELKNYILNIYPYSFELYITMVEEHKDILEDIYNTFSKVKVEIVENRGYDIGPFIHIINKLNLDDYSYIIKLHTKRNLKIGASVNTYNSSGSRMRNWSLSFMKDHNFKKCLQSFENNSKLGMIGNFHLIIKGKDNSDSEARKGVMKLLYEHNIPYKGYGFVAGTMFMCRGDILKILQKLQLKITDFDIPDKKHTSNLAHVIERFFGLSTISQEYDIRDVCTPKIYQYISRYLFFPIREIHKFIYRAQLDKQGYPKIRICRIPLPRFISTKIYK